ncbi:MAG: 1-acyl-sn-glycerol-3-phosphate acyltransferase [Planctomycetes bacterium]|nr:1-acyl-sn-glycerol-3-phosphate acyltransferase [Planctomycetota bacterium]
MEQALKDARGEGKASATKFLAERPAGWLNRISFRLLHAGSWLVAKLYFRLRVENAPKLSGPFVVVANHSSFLDPVLLAVSMSQRVCYLMTVLHFRSAFLGWFYRWNRAIPVEMRGSNREPLRVARTVLERGEVLGIFPEGGLSRDGEMLLGSPGAVSLVLNNDVPIVAVHIDGAFAAFPAGGWPRPRKVTVRFADPVRIDELLGEAAAQDRRQRLRLATRAIMDRIATTGGVRSRESWLEARALAMHD